MHVGADCTAALTVVQGQAATPEWDLAARAAVSLNALVAMQAKRIFFHKVLAHANCALNDLADCVAKAVGKQPQLEATRPFETFWEAVVEGVIDHLWLVPANPATAVALPPLSDTGTWSRAHCVVSVGEPACRPF